jgi:CBS domain-containing protein
MSRRISRLALREVTPLRATDTIETAVAALLETDLPALPVLDERGRYAGIFGEREFMGAVFPGYLRELKYAGFLKRSLDDALKLRDACRLEDVGRHMNTEHVDVPADFADAEIAEIFFHHRVLVVPVVEDGQVLGILTRHDFFRAVAERFAEHG